jgi:hypothetical protein
VTATDPAAATITVKDDKTAVESVVSLAQTRSIFRVQPGAKDLKGATRITAADLAAGDRVDVRGSKDAAGSGIVARSVVLMSARDLAQKHQQEMQAWQTATIGTVTAIDPASQALTVSVRTGDGPKSLSIQTGSSTAFTRYSTANPKAPASSTFTAIQPGDQLHIIGQKAADGSSMTAEKIYSVSARTVAATVISIAPDSKQITVRDLQDKQPVTVLLTDDSAIRKLPPEMAAMMARRFNPGARPAGATGPSGAPQNSGAAGGAPPPPSGEAASNSNPAAGNPGSSRAGQAGGPRRSGGDLSRMLQQVPQITVSDLKPGDAVVVWGVAGDDPKTLAANVVLAGVEPVLQSAPPRQGRSLSSDWNLDTSVPAQ